MIRQEDVQSTVEEAIQETLVPEECPGSLLTAWVLITEWVDPADGEKVIQTATGDGQAAWLTGGMLSEARAIYRRVMDDAWDDDD